MASLPIAGSAAGVLNQVALNHQVAGVLLGIDRAVHIDRQAPGLRAHESPPAGDVAVLHDYILHSGADEHPVDAGIFQLESPEDDVVGFYHNIRSEEHTSELQSHVNLVCRLLLE